MEWSKKAEMISLLNQGKYKDAVQLLDSSTDWENLDLQALHMFVTGLPLTRVHYCRPIKEKLQKVLDDIELMKNFDMRASVRLSLILCKLEQQH